MSLKTQLKKSSYSSFYKIYRRMRFIRYKNKLQKRKLLEIRRKKAQEQAEIEKRLKDFNLSEEKKNRLKTQAERVEFRRYKKELKAEFRERKTQARKEWVILSRKEKMQIKKARRAERNAKKRFSRPDAGMWFRNSFSYIRSINLQTIKQNFNEFSVSPSLRKQFAVISINSTTLYLLAYLSLYLFSQIITVIAAGFFHYPTIVYYYEIYFNISSDAWFHDSVKTIFSAGPIINFVVGISFLIIYNNIREQTGPFKLFFLWGFLHAVNMLFGALLVGTLFETGVGHVISWMYIMDTGRVLYSILSIFLLVIAGIMATKQFLISGNTYYNEINKTNRTFFIISQVLMPYFIGNAILIFLRQPRFVFYDSFIGFTIIACILPILATYRSFNELYFEEEEKKPRIDWLTVIILILSLIFYRGVLEIGLRFGG